LPKADAKLSYLFFIAKLFLLFFYCAGAGSAFSAGAAGAFVSAAALSCAG
jgi:hypothetical protein